MLRARSQAPGRFHQKTKILAVREGGILSLVIRISCELSRLLRLN